MIIEAVTGEYLRGAQNNMTDIAFMMDLMQHWPTRKYDFSEITSMVKQGSELTPERLAKDKISVADGILIYCLADDTPIGAVRLTIEGELISVVQFDFMIVHPDYQGQGYFSKMVNMLSRLITEGLRIEEAYFEILHSAPQALNKAMEFNPKEAGVLPSQGTDKTRIFMSNSLIGEEKRAEVRAMANLNQAIPEVAKAKRQSQRAGLNLPVHGQDLKPDKVEGYKKPK